ncbi:hypothetical protein C8F01DRAFT_1369471 [Mycena amicta]|nr:hypothetical protein C8F01DRAFT_1369471 [Mycena amicta]
MLPSVYTTAHASLAIRDVNLKCCVGLDGPAYVVRRQSFVCRWAATIFSPPILDAGSTSALNLENLDNTSHRVRLVRAFVGYSRATLRSLNLPAFSFLWICRTSWLMRWLRSSLLSAEPPPPPNLAFTTEATRTYQLREMCNAWSVYVSAGTSSSSSRTS